MDRVVRLAVDYVNIQYVSELSILTRKGVNLIGYGEGNVTKSPAA